MNSFTTIDFNINSNPWIAAAIALIIFIFTFYIYRVTIPRISSILKYLLLTLRFLALLLIAFAILEPVLSVKKTQIIQKKNFVLLDRSKSIKNFSKASDINSLKNELNSLNNKPDYSIYSFGNKIERETFSDADSIKFNESLSDFSAIADTINKYPDLINSALIISDGLMNSGSNPLFKLEQTGIPVFTIGIGDTSVKRDLILSGALYNEYIYNHKTTPVKINILNTGFGGKEITAQLFADNELISNKKVILERSGYNSVTFDYTPETAGEKKILVKLSELPGEISVQNNRGTYYLNVLENKIRITIVAGKPSPDLYFIKNSLADDENFEINSIVEISNTIKLNGQNISKIKDSTDVMFLLDFPRKASDKNLISAIFNALKLKNIPTAVLIDSQTDLANLTGGLKNLSARFVLTDRPEMKISRFSVTENLSIVSGLTENQLTVLNNLPPITQPSISVIPKSFAKTILSGELLSTNIKSPVIIAGSSAGFKSIIINAKNLWRWKLNPPVHAEKLFNKLFVNSVKWLSAKDDIKKFKVESVKRIFSPGEQIKFTANLYDDALNPVNGALIKVIVNKDNEYPEFVMKDVGNGLYNLQIPPMNSGEYSFSATVNIDGSEDNSNGKFTVSEIDIEKIRTRMDTEFLNSIAQRTGGRFAFLSNSESIFADIDRLSQNAAFQKTDSKSYQLWSDELLLIIVILLLSIEWFLRKRAGMI